MDSYTITIAPNDDSGAATRLVVDTSGDQVRITDVHLHAPAGLSSGHIPTVDFALLLQAVTGAGGQTTADGTTALVASQPSTPAIEAVPEPQPAPTAPKRRARKATPAVEAAPAKRAARPRTAKAAPVAEPRRQARTAAKTAKTTAAPAKKQTAARTRTKAPAAPTPSGRVYRRTPDDLAEVFEQVETVAGIAEHYGVPRYTAQGWVNRLRDTA